MWLASIFCKSILYCMLHMNESKFKLVSTESISLLHYHF
jgi:hypothetical protein